MPVAMGLLISVPHAGLRVPSEVSGLCQLTAEQIAADGDVGAATIYAALKGLPGEHVTTDVARAVVDLNRAPHDRRKDGVVKTHTCWDVPIYGGGALAEDLADLLIERYHRPYHDRLTALASRRDLVALGIDCHTMAAEGPPVGPDPGKRRPMVCLGNADGTCPHAWAVELAEAFARHYHPDVRINEPFAGGYITRHHGREMPWIQLELSRAPVYDDEEKGRRVRDALSAWTATR